MDSLEIECVWIYIPRKVHSLDKSGSAVKDMKSGKDKIIICGSTCYVEKENQ